MTKVNNKSWIEKSAVNHETASFLLILLHDLSFFSN